jgi:cyclase
LLTKRIIPCLDVRDGQVTKGIKFKGNVDIGDPVKMARKYYEDGADELVFYDITASNEKRKIMIDTVDKVAREIFIPFSVGGGIRHSDEMREVLLAGAEKISIDSGAVRNEKNISDGAKAFGSQCIVLSMQVQKTKKTADIPSGFQIVIDGGRTPTDKDAIEWAKRGEELGAGEICVNSINQDGTKSGYDIELTAAIAEAVGIPVIASGGAGSLEDLYEIFTKGKADAAIIASLIHYGTYTIGEIKKYLKEKNIPIRG